MILIEYNWIDIFNNNRYRYNRNKDWDNEILLVIKKNKDDNNKKFLYLHIFMCYNINIYFTIS